MNNFSNNRTNERGGAGVKLLITLFVLFLIGHAGYNYIPVAYEAESMRSEMQTAVLQGMALPGKVDPVDNVRTRIQTAGMRNNVPANVIIDVKAKAQVVTARVAYDKEVNILPLGIYRYIYKFDHTATPSGLLAEDAKAR